MNKQSTPMHGTLYKEHTASIGWFDQPFREINIQDALEHNHYWLSLISKYRKKNWFYFFAASQDHLLAGAMFNGGYYCEFFIYLYSRASHQLVEFQGSSLSSDTASIAPSSIEDESVYQQDSNLFRISSIENGWL